MVGNSVCDQLKKSIKKLDQAHSEPRDVDEALRESEERYRALMRSSFDQIFILTREGVYLDSNDRVGHFGLDSGASLTGRSLTDVYPGELGLFYSQQVERVFATGEPLSFEHPLHHGEEKLHHLDTLFPIYRDGVIWAVGGICRNITDQKELEESLRDSERRLRELGRQVVEMEQTERKQIAENLHDRVGQNLAALNINLNVLRNQLCAQCARDIRFRLLDCMDLVEETTRFIRDVMAELRPEMLDEYGLKAAISSYAERFSRRYGIHVTVEDGEFETELSKTAESALFSVFQEAMTNVAKHSRAKSVAVTLEKEKDAIVLKLADDGIGLPARRTQDPAKGWGILMMKERAMAGGGRCEITSQPGKGTVVTVRVERANHDD